MKRPIVLALVLLVLAAVQAQSRTRVFIDSVEYTGPTFQEDGVLWVHAERFARAAGWFVKKADAALCMAPTLADCKLAEGAQGLYIKDQPVTGRTQRRDGALYVALPDLAAALGGTLTELSKLSAVRLSAPSMPVARATPTRTMVEVAQYTLVEFYADW